MSEIPDKRSALRLGEGSYQVPAHLLQQRELTRARLKTSVFDVLVIGGGIVGAGVARDAAMRGLHVGLVEQYDFAFGTSSRSSRLLHGGLRYLAQGRIGLVREASREKCILHRIAPHLAQPLPFVFPTYRRTSWPLWQLRIGVKLYDWLCGGQNLGRSSALSGAEVEARLSGIRTAGLTGGVRYFDALTNDARLVIDSLRSAAQYGAIVLNYSQVEDVSPVRSQGWECQVRDRVSNEVYALTAHNIVNATGPWAPRMKASKVALRLTKGVHLVVDGHRCAVPDACVLVEGNRILFAIPWGERVILGTTDTDYSGSLDDVPVEPSDIDYVLGVINRGFPGVQLQGEDVLATWAGVRPLVTSVSGNPSDISRAHQITMPSPGWFDVVGGKLTTYRLIGEQVIDRVAARTPKAIDRCRTAEESLLSGLESASASGASAIVPPKPDGRLVEHYCRAEWAVFPEDVMRRRGGWQYYCVDAEGICGNVRDWMAGWHGER